MADYAFLISDALTGHVIVDMPFVSVRYRKGRKQPGSLTCTISSRHPKATPENLMPVRNIINVMRNGECVWAGPIWVITVDDFFGEQLTVNAEGMFSYLTEGRRVFREDYGYGGDALVWANTLVGMAQQGDGYDLRIRTNDSITSNEIAYVDYDVSIEDLRCIGDDIIQYSNAGRNEDGYYQGFDFDVSGRAVDDVFTYTFDIGWPTFRSYWSEDERRFVDQKVYEIDVDSSSVTKYGLRMNGKEMAKLIDVVGDLNSIVTVADNKDIALGYPMIQKQLRYETVQEDSELHALGDAALRKRVLPVSLPMLTTEVSTEVPVYNLKPGSYVRLDGGVGYVKGTRLAEIEAWEVAVDNEGKELATLQFTEVPETDPVLSTGTPIVVLRTPVVTNVVPDQIDADGGTKVLITGSYFSRATDVLFSGGSALSWSVLNDNTIVAIAPPGANGKSGYVSVQAGDLYSTTTSADQRYWYYNQEPPVITTMSPTTVAATGGTTVTLTGMNFNSVGAPGSSAVIPLNQNDPTSGGTSGDGTPSGSVLMRLRTWTNRSVTQFSETKTLEDTTISYVACTDVKVANATRLTFKTPAVYFTSGATADAYIVVANRWGVAMSPMAITVT